MTDGNHIHVFRECRKEAYATLPPDDNTIRRTNVKTPARCCHRAARQLPLAAGEGHACECLGRHP